MKILERKFTCKCGTTFEYDDSDIGHNSTHKCAPRDRFILTAYCICPSCKNYCILNVGLDPSKHDALTAHSYALG